MIEYQKLVLLARERLKQRTATNKACLSNLVRPYVRTLSKQT